MTKSPEDPRTHRSTYRSAGCFAWLGLHLGGLAAAGHWFNVGGSVQGDTAVSVQDAFSGARNGEFTLIDIRRPDEWARTGVGVGAIPIDMRDRDFVAQLLAKVSEQRRPHCIDLRTRCAVSRS